MRVLWTPRFRIWGFLALIAIMAVLLAVMRPTRSASSGLPSSSMPELGTSLPGGVPGRIAGQWRACRSRGGVLVLTVPGIQEPLRLPLAGLRSLVVLRHEAPGGKQGSRKHS